MSAVPWDNGGIGIGGAMKSSSLVGEPVSWILTETVRHEVFTWRLDLQICWPPPPVVFLIVLFLTLRKEKSWEARRQALIAGKFWLDRFVRKILIQKWLPMPRPVDVSVAHPRASKWWKFHKGMSHNCTNRLAIVDDRCLQREKLLSHSSQFHNTRQQRNRNQPRSIYFHRQPFIL